MPSIEIIGVPQLKAQFTARATKSRKSDNVGAEVGYMQSYAIYVHENLVARHKPGQQAKYLEAPARIFQLEIGKVVADTYRQTGDMTKSLLAGCQRLLYESQQIVPVDTGALKASGYAATAETAAQEAAAAAARGAALRESKLAGKYAKPLRAKPLTAPKLHKPSNPPRK